MPLEGTIKLAGGLKARRPRKQDASQTFDNALGCSRVLQFFGAKVSCVCEVSCRRRRDCPKSSFRKWTRQDNAARRKTTVDKRLAKGAVKRFCEQPTTEIGGPLSLTEQAMAPDKVRSEYVKLSWIPPTSDEVERLS
ncbi:TPA: hypothetical protein N0F65_009496 [Lagenidium giganteum]|uniref:Uncharacterized protein n=1 Tax=Lagenidium giganteum TaxID=4803 RepID=A0AAV2ZD86_9STRA|nr:TPA: hypothetical protein N0F65_009496 [Lagenidium giganteum]